MNENEFDNKIKERLNKSAVSKRTTYTIIDTVKKCSENSSNNVKSKVRKASFTTALAFILTPCIVLATGYALANFGLNKVGLGSKSLDNAIQSGYIQKIDSNTIYEKEVNYKFSDALLNDNILLISIDFNFEDSINEFKDISFKGLQIYDDNGKQLYIDSEDQNIWTKNIASSFTNFATLKEDKHIRETLLLTSSNFNDIKKLNIKFDSIVLYLVEDGNTKTKEITLNKNSNINLDIKFNDRENISYNIENESINSSDFYITKINLTNTGLIVTFNARDDFSGPAYNFELLDKDNNIIYSNKNIISASNTNFKENYAWLDVDANLKDKDIFKIRIIDNNKISNTYILNK